MRRIMLSALLSLALPTAALASTIDVSDPPPSFSTGTFVRGALNRTVSAGIVGTLNATILGNMTQIHIGGAAISPGCNPPPGMCTFTGGTATVMNATLTATLFTASISTGTITNTGTSAMIFANLTPNQPRVGPAGGFVKLNIFFTSASSPITGGTGQLVVIPEPSTLGLLGTGLIGLAGMARRKLRPGT